VLFYTYPMKFMFSMITVDMRRGGDAAMLFLIYGLGFAGIFALFVAMYVRAWRKREELGLNAVERFDTITNMIMYASYVGIGLLSMTVGLTVPARMVGWAGMTYFLLGPVSAFIGYRRGSARPRLEVAIAQTMPNAMQTEAVPSVAAVGPNASDASPAPRPDKAIVRVTNP
jgi:hypothetical protein